VSSPVGAAAIDVASGGKIGIVIKVPGLPRRCFSVRI
jgi:hypothetical protein